MERKKELTRMKPGAKQRNQQDGNKGADTTFIGKIVEWDTQLTSKITSLMESKFPDITKTENKLLEVNRSIILLRFH